MDKIIKALCVLFLIHINFKAQSWQQVMINYDSKCIAFNPYDSTLWLVKKYPAHNDKNGILTEYNISIVPDFNFVGFLCSKPVFTSSGIYCLPRELISFIVLMETPFKEFTCLDQER